MKVLYFSQAAGLTGCREEVLDISHPMTSGGFWEEVVRRHPGLAALRSVCRLACNEEYLSAEGTIQPDDEVAVIPPVSGG